jgi:SET domain-containing protein
LTVSSDFGEVFYKAIRDIDAGEELLVYYGEKYAKGLGINTTQFHL